VKKQPAVRIALASALAALAAAPAALAQKAALTVQQVEVSQKTWPKSKAYVNVIGASGSPIQGLSADLFKVYEEGDKDSSRILRVESLEQTQAGASILLVVQASGAMSTIEAELKKALAAFMNGLGEKDQIAVVAYGENAELICPFTDDKGACAGNVNKLAFSGKSFLLYDGLALALATFAQSGAAGKGGAVQTSLPAAKAIIVISDGRDNGSGTDVEKIIADANKRRLPIHSVGHSEMEQDSLVNVEQVSQRTGAVYKAAPNTDDISKGLTVLKDFINKMYVIEWKTQLEHDGKDHKIDVAMENESGTSLKGSIVVRTPKFIDWLKIGIIAGSILFVLILAAVIYVVTRPKPPPTRFCPVCRRAQMPEWEICLFCLKAAKARLLVQKGANKGKVYPLIGKIVSIGSGPENNIRIMDGSVSSKHAGVAIDETKFEIVDLGSKNGVLVNGKKTPRRFLRNGDVITLGMTEFKFESTVSGGDDADADD
jgi:VWFA-related protein